MSQFFLHQPTAAEPKPNAAQGGQTIYFGTYQGPFDSNFNQGVASAATNKSQVFGAGIDDANHDSDSIQWITYPLASSSTGSGIWKADVWLDVSAVPLSGRVTFTASIFKWLANDTLSGRIGVVITTGNLTTTVTKYTLTFAAATSDTNNDNDRYLLDGYFNTQDAASLGDSGIYTFRVRYDSSTRPSSFTLPGTQTQYVYNRILPSTGAGI